MFSTYRTLIAIAGLNLLAVGRADEPTAWSKLEWKKAAPAPFARVESPTAVVDGKLFLFGGFTDSLSASSQVDVYDPATDAWTRWKDMPTQLTHLNPATDGSTIWFAGGFKGKHPGVVSDEVWKYDTASDTWTAGPPLPEPRAGGGLAVVGRALHYFGGYKSDRQTDAGDHWSLPLDGEKIWKREADMPDPRGHVSAAVLDGKIYALGGDHGHDKTQIDVSSCHRFDPVTKQWSAIASLPDGRSHFESSTIIHHGRILIVGGRCNQTPRNVVGDLLEYDPKADAWRVVGDLPVKVLAPAAAIIAGRIVVTGGGLNNPRPLTPDTWVAPLPGNTKHTFAPVLQPFVDSHALAGAVVLVADKDKVLALETVGSMDLAAKKPMRTDSLFWVASQSKPIAATAIMMLAEEGRVSLDDPVEKFLPEFKGQMFIAEKDGAKVLLKKPARPISVRNLLTHTTGLPYRIPIEEDTLDLLPLAARVRGYAMTPLEFEPGTKFLYSNAAINTAARLVEVVSGKPYDQFLAERLFGPLGMKDTTFWPNDEQVKRVAKAYKPDATGKVLEVVPIPVLAYPLNARARRFPVPGNGLFSTAHDLSRFYQMMLNGGQLAGRRFLSENAVKEMTRRQTPPEWKQSQGLGFALGLASFGHGGSYFTNANAFTDSGLILVWLVQHASFPGDGAKAQDVFKKTALATFTPAKPATPPSKKPPEPARADVSYGAHPHQIMDIHLPANGSGPFPVLIWFGGIWQPGKHVPDLSRFVPKQIAVIGVETRTLTDGVADKANPPVSYVMNDAARAVQFVRLNAAKWNLDPQRIAVGGGSQGALPALYVGCAADRADPQASDPVERVSSLVTCVAAYRSQPSIDPKRMQEWVPGVKWGAPALGCSFEESLARGEELLPLIQKWSPEALLHKTAAPIYFENNWGLTQPETVSEMDYKVHSAAWALGFQKLALEVGAVCHVKFPDHPTDGYTDIWDFIVQELKRVRE